jgi:hypothetical protein
MVHVKRVFQILELFPSLSLTQLSINVLHKLAFLMVVVMVVLAFCFLS